MKKAKKVEVVVELSEQEKARYALRMLVRSRDDFQNIRKNLDNRLGRKADGTMQNLVEERPLDEEYLPMIEAYADTARGQEEKLEKNIKDLLKKFPVHEEFLKGVPGVGPIASAWIISEFDIRIADTVSKMWQFAGMNPGMVRGKKRKQNDDGTFAIITTDKLVRGDKRTKDFVSPFNGRLRAALLGMMADVFIKGQNSYALNFYYPYKSRKENSVAEVPHWKTKGKPAVLTPWNEVSKGHRDDAAKRFMVKAFLKDLYVAWRTVEGLPVREPYAEEYLGRKHSESIKVGRKLALIK